MRSNDSGELWSQLDVGTTLTLKSLVFPDADHGWVVGNEEIHYQFDEADAWHGKIWHTSDGGDTWVQQELPDSAGLIHRLYFLNNLEGWAVGVKNQQLEPFSSSRGAAYYTKDGGETWTEGFAPDLKLVFTDMDFTDADHGFLVGFPSVLSENNGSIFMTSDGGENWQRAPEYSTLWQVDFIDSLRGYAVGSDYISAWGPPVFRTMDGGSSWEKIHMKEHKLQGLFGLAVFGDRVIAMGDEGMLIRSDDPWGEYGAPHGENLFGQQLIDTLYDFEDVFFINPLKGWVVGKKSGGPDAWEMVIMHTDNGGEEWKEQYSFYTDVASYAFRLNAVQFLDERIGWAVGHTRGVGEFQCTGILFTDDGGQTWTEQGAGITQGLGQIVDLFFFENGQGWALSNAKPYPDPSVRLLRTHDYGETWDIVNTGHEALITIGYGIRNGTLCFPDQDTGWILGARCDLLRTRDGGASWEVIPLPDDWVNTFDIGFSSEMKGAICGERNYYSVDRGDHWTSGEDTPVTCTDMEFVDSLHGWMVGEWGTVCFTGDGGASWDRKDYEATQAALKSVSFPDARTGWAAGRAGAILRIESPAATAVHRGLDPGATGLSLQCVPNPFKVETRISFRLQGGGHAILSVFDIQGREVARLMEGYLPPGSYSRIWARTGNRGESVEPGVYILRLWTLTGSATRRLVVY